MINVCSGVMTNVMLAEIGSMMDNFYIKSLNI